MQRSRISPLFANFLLNARPERVATTPRTLAGIEREFVEPVPQADRAQGKVGRFDP